MKKEKKTKFTCDGRLGKKKEKKSQKGVQFGLQVEEERGEKRENE